MTNPSYETEEEIQQLREECKSAAYHGGRCLNAVWYLPDLSPVERTLISFFGSEANFKSNFQEWIKIKSEVLAERLGYRKADNLMKSVRSLIKRGYLAKRTTTDQHGRQAENEYALTQKLFDDYEEFLFNQAKERDIKVASFAWKRSGSYSPEIGGTASPEIGGTASPETGGAASPETGGAASPEIGGTASPEIGGTASPETGGAASPEIGGTYTNPSSPPVTPPSAPKGKERKGAKAPPVLSLVGGNYVSFAKQVQGCFDDPDKDFIHQCLNPFMAGLWNSDRVLTVEFTMHVRNVRRLRDRPIVAKATNLDRLWDDFRESKGMVQESNHG